ncbi:hypothetical protein FKW77_008319 [Venturia effusa]|uniref:Thioesterase domain-containing protein n=1 Tax=Venturia effusa TaxID=50376 RepID=A0A517LJJ8_9PEZI|nr:hypothetical protein FKW77_008319 [Venturia effusa]
MCTELRSGNEHIAYFKTIPWCRTLIENPFYHTSSTNSRHPKGTTEDSFFAETLQTDRTIRRCLTLHVTPDDDSSYSTMPIRTVLTFFEVGDGVNGFPHICHGGFVATLLDEVMGILLSVNQEYLHREKGEPLEITSMTASINVKYLAPVTTPGILLGRAWVERLEKRKIFIRSGIEDGEGKELTVAEALFVKARKDPRASL